MIHEEVLGARNYNILRNIIIAGNFLQFNRGAEIGVFRGDTSENLLAEFPLLTLYCVDPYSTYEQYPEEETKQVLAAAEQECRQKLTRFGDRAIPVKEFSIKAAGIFPDNSLDFVFIDANHEYEFVKEDMEIWFPKVRPGGLFSGHDYRWGGVNRAVNEWSAKVGYDGFASPADSDVWYFIKK